MRARTKEPAERELNAKTSYAVLIPTKNGEATIEQTLRSIVFQTVPPKQIIVIDDASRDATAQILKKFSQATIIRLEHNLPRDFSRVLRLISLGLRRVSEPCSYVMISGDDSSYPDNYVQILLEEFEKDPRLFVCSGIHTKQKILDEATPHGSGRIIRYSFLKQVLPIPESVGWEGWIVFKARQMGGRVKRIQTVSYQHLRSYGSSTLWAFGQGMYELGYPFWFVLARLVKNIVFEPNKLQQLTMLGGFIEFELKRKPKLDISEFVVKIQIDRTRRLIIR